MSDLTLLLRRIERREAGALDEFIGVVYAELREMAVAKMAREPDGQTLQPTALVHEAWLRLGGETQPNWQNRAHFFGAAAEAMRRILIDAARRKHAVRRGGGVERVDVDDFADVLLSPASSDELLQVSDSLDRLAAEDERKAELVKLRYFVGLTLEESADVLGVSTPTAKRDWAYARAWLFDDINQQRR